ncbi:DUF6492 family protein [Microbacterium sp.]|uniref:DUF6492 family protein n=1 Tax=Microbacterium sp. TaxID=51671 RepID=UPI0028115E79|nr:DUF6492 family protein [Microbacterium sp.]
MTSRTLELITPSYAPDFELCRDLVASARRFAPPGTRHRLLVPRRDLGLFAQLRGDGVEVHDVAEVLPRTLRRVPGWNGWIDVGAPWPPVRGWVAQQLVKLAATASSTADEVLVVDSDVVFVRPFGALSPDDGELLYRLPHVVDSRLPRHILWDDVSRRLLGLPASEAPTRHDYICWPCPWSPRVVRMMLERISAVAGGAPWARVIGRELHVSEMVLYGVFVDEVLARQTRVVHTDDTRCLTQPDEITFDRPQMRAFLDGLRPSDTAVMVSAKSGTAMDLRREEIARITETIAR